MSRKTTENKSLSLAGSSILTLLITLIFSLGAIATWATLVRWLPTEEVAVRVVGSESRRSPGYSSRAGSPTYWIKVVDENGLRQDVVCMGQTYSALRSGSTLFANLKLIRNPLCKTPVAFLKSPSSNLKIDPESALGKVLAAGGERETPKEPKRLELMKYPLVFLLIGVAFMGGAFWMFTRVVKISGNRHAAIANNMTAMALGTAFGIYWSSGLL